MRMLLGVSVLLGVLLTAAKSQSSGELAVERGELTPSGGVEISHTWNDELFKPQHAIDKDLSTGILAVPTSGTSVDAGVDGTWIKFNFGQTVIIERIVIHYMFHTNWYSNAAADQTCHTSIARWQSCAMDDSGGEVAVYTRSGYKIKSCGILTLSSSPDQAEQIYTMECEGARGDFVKISRDTGTGYINVYEVIFFGVSELTPTGGVQISHTWNDELFKPQHAIDKRLNTGIAVDAGVDGTWIKFNFGRTVLIKEILIHYMFYTRWFSNADQSCQTSIASWQSCTSADSGGEVAVYTRSGTKVKSCGILTLSSGLTLPEQVYTMDCEGARGGYVKISKDTGAGNINVYEVVFFGCPQFERRKGYGAETELRYTIEKKDLGREKKKCLERNCTAILCKTIGSRMRCATVEEGQDVELVKMEGATALLPIFTC